MAKKFRSEYFILDVGKVFFMKALQILKAITEIESPSGREEKLAKYIFNYLNDLGHDVFMEALNVLLYPEKDFIVATHLDTFKVLMPFSFDGKYAYGTGVCDAKASIASIILALEKISEPNFGVAFFYDEEEDGQGSEIFCRKYKPKEALVMEPTNLTIANVQYGGLELLIETGGVASHGATPEKGENAIERCVEIINRLKELKEAIVSVQFINGGKRDDFAIPDSCEMRVEIMFKPNVKAEKILEKVNQICFNKAKIFVKEIYDGFISGEVTKLVEQAITLTGLEVKFSEMPSWNDSINLRELANCDTVVFGPGELYLCHTKNERVKLRDIEIASETLVKLNKLL
ncbi:M20/M25/M40 family metallo-hydrolase [Candidatus Bathyarchaeota archaeon]|nr:M20/M25/M40 family metallo-hydrolase [Candidatus Bathyarchaeota archaeon]